ncbi:MAG: thiol reductant ABC exporter subunit CydC [Demequinaceae bacterium]|nr:thiol reductant ABC exporter subunit CydC [Demequinaceae bacterium]
MRGKARTAGDRRPRGSGLWGDLDLRWMRVAAAILAGSGALGSAVGLTATSAWLIARAAEMPSPADLAIAAVLVRTLGIGRGALRYAERLRSHDTSLRGVASLRTRAYERLEAGRTAQVMTLPKGEIMARIGADLDAIGDVVVRALVPLGVAVVVSATAVGIVGSQHPGAAACLAACLVVAAILPAVLTARATRISQEEGAQTDAAVSVAALSALEGATEHRVWGTTAEAASLLDDANARQEQARESAARPAALAAAIHVLAAGVALVTAVLIGIAAVTSGDLTGPAAAVVALTPLAAFEAVGALPAASAQASRSRAAAARVRGLFESAGLNRSEPSLRPSPAPADDPDPRAAFPLELDRVRAAWPGGTPTSPVDARLAPGQVIGIIGPSGIGKTTLLLTMCGALPPVSGEARISGRRVTPADTGIRIAMTAEDAHVFGTSIIENLRVARGDVTHEEADRVLALVGLGPWLARQPEGLDTILGSGGLSVSGGERRRLLLARVLLHPAPIHLIDEPGEHLDEAGTDIVQAIVEESRAAGRSLVIVTHDHALLKVVDTVVDLGKVG